MKATTPAKAVCVTWIQILCWVQKDLGSFSCVVEEGNLSDDFNSFWRAKGENGRYLNVFKSFYVAK